MRIKKLAVLAAFAALTLSSCATGPTSDTTSAATTPSGTSESSDASEETSEATTSTDYTGQELIVTSFGGDWEVAFIEAVVDPFEADTGASVTLVTAYSADAMAQLQAAASNPPFDVIHFSGGQESLAAESGLISPIDSADLSTFDDLVPVAVEGLERGEGPVIQVAPVGVVYNTEMVTDVPTSFEDIFRPEYAQHIALTDISNTYGLFTLLAVNDLRGGDLSDVQPGVDALSALATSGDAIVVATSADLQQAFSARDIWIAPYAQDYAETLRKAGLPVEFALPEGAPGSFITANVVANRPNQELATLFIDYALRPEAQAIFAGSLLYSPTNATTTVPSDIADRVLHGEAVGDLVRYDSVVVSENRQTWVDLWNNAIS